VAVEQDILNYEFRRNVTDQITAAENDYRKEESRRRFDIWRGNAHEIIKHEMLEEYTLKTVEKFRVQSSINLVPRIVKEKASIYKSPPTREFTNLNDEQTDYVLELYETNKYNIALKQANQFFKLQDQDQIQVLPKEVNGQVKLCARVLQPHHVDVIPREDSPEDALVYIVNLNDENKHISTFQDSTDRKLNRNFTDQDIADWDDQRRLLARFAWWSDNYNFITDGFGDIKSDSEDIANPLGELNFIDVANPAEKDFRFWVYKESLMSRFQIDFAKDLTDLTENIKMQGFATGLLIATKKPEIVDVGPRKMMFLPLDPQNPDARPSFDFKTPSPDITGQMQVIQDKLAMYLTSDDIDPKTISGKTEANKFTSGVERLLAQIQRFEATKDDLAVFKDVEWQLYDKVKKYNNVLASQNVPGYQFIPEDSEVNVSFNKPEKLETQDELEARWINLRNEGLATQKRAIMEIYHVEGEKADELLLELADEFKQPEVIEEQDESAETERE
jgi:hypothetical protein